jgi:hypothetical protein
MHGQNQTEFITRRAAGTPMEAGQFLDDEVAARFILEHLDELRNGSISIPMPEGFPARVIKPDGTFAEPTHIHLVPGGRGVKTSYPEVQP